MITWETFNWRHVVEQGGGEYVGIQEGLAYDLVLFNAPSTGSTLAIKSTAITSAKVREHIAQHVADWNCEEAKR